MIEFTNDVRPSTILLIDVNAQQKLEAPLTPLMLYHFINTGKSWGCKLDGKFVAIGGYTPVWEGRAVVWGLLGNDCRKAMPAMTRRIKKELTELRVAFPRVEAYTARHHEEGHRWLKMLGFVYEGPLRKFFKGKDYCMYVKAD